MIFTVPLMILQAIKFAILAEEYDQENSILSKVVSCVSLLFLWWFINFALIIALNTDMSTTMILIETLYALITLWFFVIITLKAFKKSSYTILCNPLIIIIGLVSLILVALISAMPVILISLILC